MKNKISCMTSHDDRHGCPWNSVCHDDNHACIKGHRCNFGTESVTWRKFTKTTKPRTERAFFVAKQRDLNASYDSRYWLGIKCYYEEEQDFFTIFMINEIGMEMQLVGDSKALDRLNWYFFDLPLDIKK